MKTYTTVSEFLDDLDTGKRRQVEALRKIILDCVPVTEHVKWNSPSYVYKDEDRITFNLHGDDIKILIHMGATRKEDKKAKPIMDDETGLIKWSSNMRGIIAFKDMDDLTAKKQDFENILQRWLEVE
ncbi:MAG TPA: DUF1801 domain-containing protein [Candidatus Saccharimonadales bacterium]|nr:DUF1801 domain-containing protein [Candidatus Saccharimonadales bacterium]